MSELKPCPKCGSLNFRRERSPDGKTECRGCGYTAKHAEWDNPVESTEDRLEQENASLKADLRRLVELWIGMKRGFTYVEAHRQTETILNKYAGD